MADAKSNLDAQIQKINDDPDARKALLTDLGTLLKKHGIAETDGLFGDPAESVVRGSGDSTVVVTIVY